jgi:glucose-6-phosphate-specific signal transduction histidine kinase
MESFTVPIQHELHDILGELEPQVDIALAEKKLEKLFAELDLRDEHVRERATTQLTDILHWLLDEEYQSTLMTVYQETKQNLFRLASQLEYPSRH